MFSRLGQFKLYNDYDQDYEDFTDPTVFKYNRAYYGEGSQKPSKKKGAKGAKTGDQYD